MFDRESLLRNLLESPSQFNSAGDLSGFIEKLRSHYGLKHLAYLAIDIPGLTAVEPYFRGTYTNDWINHYRDENYLAIDPVLKHGINTIIPFDWQMIDRSTKPVRAFFSDSESAGLGTQGLTVPVRGRFGELALISINSDLSLRDWKKDRVVFMQDFQLLSGFLHQSVLEHEKVVQKYEPLSPREEEVLKWLARGKTIDDIGIILGLSRHTVRVYADTARTKLNGLNITHAVARALTLSLIESPD